MIAHRTKEDTISGLLQHSSSSSHPLASTSCPHLGSRGQGHVHRRASPAGRTSTATISRSTHNLRQNQHQESFAYFHEAYSDYYNSSIFGDDSTSTSTDLSSAHEHRTTRTATTTTSRKRDLILCYSLFVVTSVVTAIMNAAITIFGMGVGVGLILGDTLRGGGSSTTVSAGRNTVPNNTTVVAEGPRDETSVVVVHPATPNCRATIRHVSSRTTRTSTAAGAAQFGGGSHSTYASSSSPSSSSSIMPAQ